MAVSDLSFAYGAKQVLSHISAKLMGRQRLCILGPNGSGKTTFLKLISGELNVPTMHWTRPAMEQIAVIPQKLHLVPQLSALSNTIHGALGRLRARPWWSMQGLAPAALRQEALSTLRALGLGEHVMKPVGALSGGLAQRVAVARALMQRPQLLLADEPTSALDPVAARTTLQFLSEAASTANCALVFTLHHPAAALANSEYALLLRSGTTIYFGPSTDVTPHHLSATYD